MARKLTQGDPALEISFFTSGFYTYRSQLFAPFKGIGVNVVSFHDPVIDGINFELTDKFEWQRRPGFSIYCSQPLFDAEIVNQFYWSRSLDGGLTNFADTNERWLTFTTSALTPLLTKTTRDQGYVQTIGDRTFFSDGTGADASIWDGSSVVPWGLAAPTVVPTLTGLNFWRAKTAFTLGQSILDPNGDIEAVTAILVPNGAFESPNSAGEIALAGSLAVDWAFDPTYGSYTVPMGFKQIQVATGTVPAGSPLVISLATAVTVGDTIIVTIGATSLLSPPSGIFVSDNLGNSYTPQAVSMDIFAISPGLNEYKIAYVYTAPVTTGGSCAVSIGVSPTVGSVFAIVHEFSGISATPSGSATNAGQNISPMFNTGTVGVSGTELVFSAVKGSLPGGAGSINRPAGYTGAIVGSTDQLQDAFIGLTGGTASPQWSTPPANSLAGITLVFPITVLTTGYTPYLFFYDFNAAIPSTATIIGVQVVLPKFNASGVGVVKDEAVKLVIGGAVSGANRASAAAWNNAGFNNAVYGGPEDLWGLSSITPAQANAIGTGGFGLAVSANFIDTSGGSLIPEVGFNAPHAPTVTIYYKDAGGSGGLGLSGTNEPTWSTILGGVVNDGAITWSNYGPILTWQPLSYFVSPVVILDPNGNLQLSTDSAAAIIPPWDSGANYAVGDVVYFGGQYWLSVLNGTNTNVVPAINYSVSTAVAGVTTTAVYWIPTTSPLTTGAVAPVWSTDPGGSTVDGSYTWTNIGQGGAIAVVGYGYVYGYRTVFGHLTTSSPFSQNTGAILGPLSASITAFYITSDVVTFIGSNNFLPGNVFKVSGLLTGTYLNDQIFEVATAHSSETFPLTATQVSGSTTLTVTAINNLAVGDVVTFSAVASAAFLNGLSFTVISSGLSGTQFECTIPSHSNYGPTADTGNVSVVGNYTAAFTHGNEGSAGSPVQDSGAAQPLIATVAGAGTGSALCNSVATITAVEVTANVVRVYADNNFQPGLWVTLSGLTGATFLNSQQVQVDAVDQPLGVQNTWFEVFFETPDYAQTGDTGTATFNAIEIYRLSDGGGNYLFAGAVTNTGANIPFTYDDFTVDDDLDILLVAPLSHQNDPPPGTPGSTVQSAGTIMTYWQGRLWLVVGKYVYFDAGPDCTNGLAQEAWPPANRFQFSGPPLGLEPTPDGVGLLVYLADRVNVILGGPETSTFYPTDFLDNFGIANPNAKFRDGATIGQFTTQKQYMELAGTGKDFVGEHIADYMTDNFKSEKSYVTLHRNGLDVGVWVSNGIDRALRFGTNPHAWSVPYFPSFGAGAMRSIETSTGIYSLLLATPAGGKTLGVGPENPGSGASIADTNPAWVNPGNITQLATAYATVAMDGVATQSQVLRASLYQNLNVPRTAVVQGVQVRIIGNQNDTTRTSVKITPTNGGASATSHTFQFGSTDTTLVFGSSNDTWNMPTWQQPYLVDDGTTLSFDIEVVQTAAIAANVAVAKVQVTVTYQTPGNYIYARDLNSWGDCGVLGENTGTPYLEANIVVGNITLTPPGARLMALQHIVGYFNAVGTLNDGGPSQPDVWILPNEVEPGTEVPFIQLTEVVPEPPVGQNKPSSTIQQLRWPVNMMNSDYASQWMHHLQVKIQFEPENAPNTVKALAFMEGQDT